MQARDLPFAALLLAAILLPRAHAAEPLANDCFTLSAKGLFALDSNKLSKVQPELDRLARVLNKNPDVSGITIRGYTDRLGDEARNMALSQRRADAVKDYLVARGVAPERLEAVGMGEADALVECTGSGAALERCLQPNRRVVVDGITVRRRIATTLDGTPTAR